jgi:hypothetical protein
MGCVLGQQDETRRKEHAGIPTWASNKDKKTLRRLSGNIFLNGDVLYKRNFDMVLLRCVDSTKHKC